MSSGTRYESRAGHDIGVGTASRFMDSTKAGMNRVARLGMTPRQQELNRLWSYYQCAQYSARKMDWDGSQHTEGLEREAIATAGYIPPGFYDAGGQMLPLKFRRPTTPYHLPKVIVDRFTGLLFSKRRHPQLQVDGDHISEDYVRTLAEVTRLWPAMIQARTLGGATGSVEQSFQFLNGKPIIEVHDPRWVFPKFKDRASLELASLEKRYIYPEDVWNREDEKWETIGVWYRRLISDTHDILYKPVAVGDGEEPTWEKYVDRVVEHNLGFCPAVWIQNIPVLDDIDGEPDCHGVFELSESIDALLAQANRGIINNCDPTLLLVTQQEMNQIKKGSDNAIKLPEGSASYLEISGTGPVAARELATELRAYALEIAQCVLDHPNNANNRTATEIERVYSSMLSKADVFREQYGERGIKPLMEKMIRAIKIIETPRTVNDEVVRYEVILPPKIIGQSNGASPIVQKRKLNPSSTVSLDVSWPDYFDPELLAVTQAVTAASNAKAMGLIDDDHATKFVAQYFNVEDIPGMIAKIKKEKMESQDSLFADIPNVGRPANFEKQDVQAAPTEAKPAEQALNGAQVTAIVDLLQQAAAGQIPLESAKAIIMMSFPIMEKQIDAMLAPIETFIPAPPKDAGK